MEKMTELTFFQKQIIENKNLLPATKKGRCFNGFERDRGTVVHYVPGLKDGDYGDWFDKSLCGSEPGYRGNGWGKSNKEVNCPKCLKIIQKQ